MKHLLISTVCAAAFATSAHATTASVDFVALVASIGEQGVEGQTFNFDGLDVTVSSTHDAYLDGLSGGLPAGLGVCSAGLDTNSQCNDPGDDNINVGESVTLTFGSAVTGLSNFMFRGAQHDNLTGSASALGSYAILFDNGSTTYGGGTWTFASVDGNVGNAIANRPNHFVTGISFIGGATPFYLSGFTADYTPAAVPLPASVVLLGGALAGFGALKRRKKA